MLPERIVCCGDIHTRETTPSMRVEEDFFYDICVPKLRWIVDLANDEKASIAIAGDIFDHANSSFEAAIIVSRELIKAKYGVYAIPGQHDMNYHSQKMIDTPYQVLIETGAIIDTHGKVVDGIFGAGFGIEPNVDAKATVLLAHFCITEKEPPFFLEDALSAENYLGKYNNFKYIISGDYHVSHVTEMDDRILINCGPMFRKERTQVDMKPCVYLLDTSDGCCEQIFIPVADSALAFDMDKIEKVKKLGISAKEIDTSGLVGMITEDKQTAITYPEVVSLVCAKYKDEHKVEVPIDRINSFLQRAVQ